MVSGGWDEVMNIWTVNGNCIHSFDLSMGVICNIQCDQNKIVAVCREDGFQNQLLIIDFGRNYHAVSSIKIV
jgi:hypothetical protein